MLEGSLLRGEEKLARLAAATASGGEGRGPGSDSNSDEDVFMSTVNEGGGQMGLQRQTTTTTTITQASSGQTKTHTIQTLDEPILAASSTTTSTSTMFATFTSPAQQPLPHLGGFSLREPSSSSSTTNTTNQTTQSAPTSTRSATALALTGTDTPAQTREEGQEKWRAFLCERFVCGGDEDFDYAGLVDNDDELDTLERREQEEAWFDEEEPDWASDGDEEGKGKVERVLEGETGVQDF